MPRTKEKNANANQPVTVRSGREHLARQANKASMSAAPVAKKPKAAPVAKKPKAAPVAKKPKAAPVAKKPKAAPVAKKPKDAPKPKGRKNAQVAEQVEQFQEQADPQIPASRTPQLTIGTVHAQEAQESVPNLSTLRLYFCARLQEEFKLKAWTLPMKSELENRTKDSFSISRKVKLADKEIEQGCKFNIQNENVTFDLLTNEPASIEALALSCSAYAKAYEQWRTVNSKLQSKLFAPIVELTVYDANEIKPILEALKAKNQSVDKIKIIDPNKPTDIKEITDPKEIDEYIKKSNNNPKQG